MPNATQGTQLVGPRTAAIQVLFSIAAALFACRPLQNSGVKEVASLSPRDSLRFSEPVDERNFVISDTNATISQIRFGSDRGAYLQAVEQLFALIKELNAPIDQQSVSGDKLAAARTLLNGERYQNLLHTVDRLLQPTSAVGSSQNMVFAKESRPAAERALQDLYASLRQARSGQLVPIATIKANLNSYIGMLIRDFHRANNNKADDSASFSMQEIAANVGRYLDTKGTASAPLRQEDSDLVVDTISYVNAIVFEALQHSVTSNYFKYAHYEFIKLRIASLQALSGPDSETKVRLIYNYAASLDRNLKWALATGDAPGPSAADVNACTFEIDRATGVGKVKQFAVVFDHTQGDDWIGYREGVIDPALDAGTDANVLRQWAITKVDEPRQSGSRFFGWLNWLFHRNDATRVAMAPEKYLKFVSLLAMIKATPKSPAVEKLAAYLQDLAGIAVDASKVGTAAARLDDQVADDAAKPALIDIDGKVYASSQALPEGPDAATIGAEERAASTGDAGADSTSSADTPDSSGGSDQSGSEDPGKAVESGGANRR